MNNQCINFRQRTKTINKRKTVYFYCAKQRKEITFEDCRSCPHKEYKNAQYFKKTVQKTQKNSRKLQSSAELKKKSNKLAKLERNRFSLFTDNRDKCMFCPSTYQLTWHEIFRGRNRQNSMRFGLCLRMCLRCHELKQEDKQFNEEWKQKGQAVFQQTYPNLNFKDIFGQNYIK